MPLLVKRLLLAIVAPIAFVLLLEAACRVAGVKPTRVEKPFRDFDLGWSFVTGKEPPYFVRSPTRFFEPRKHARGVARTDGRSLRGGDHWPRHDRTLRVAVLGDSTTFGFGVRATDSFVGRLEQALRASHPRFDVDVVNAGCPAYSTWQNRVDLDERVLPLAPDVVVLALSGFNDATGAVGLADEDWARFAPARAGGLAGLIENSRLAAGIERLLGPLWGRVLVADPDDAVRAVKEGRAPSGRRVPLEALVANEAAMIQKIRAAGARPVVLVHCHPDSEIAKDPERAKYTETIARVARDAGVECALGSSALPTAEPGFYFDKIHPTEAGHARLADLLLPLVESALSSSGRLEAAPPASAPTPRITSVVPASTPAEGGVVARVSGAGFGVGGALPPPRFFVGDEAADLVRVLDDGNAEIDLPPVAPGAHDVWVVTQAGSARLESGLLAVGPRLTIEIEKDRAKLLLTGLARGHATIHVGTKPGDEPIQLGRSLGIQLGSMAPNPIELDLGELGSASVEVPFSGAAAGASLWVQALVGPTVGDYPRVLLPSNTVEAKIPAR